MTGSNDPAVQASRPTDRLYSFVLPVFDEAGNLVELHRRLTEVTAGLDGEWEIIFVDDGSRDASLEIIRRLCAVDPRCRYLHFSRNFGHQAAITAGLDVAEGDAVIVMDSDLQHPPELVPEMIDRWREGYDIVFAIRQDRSGESWFKKKASVAFYKLLRRLSGNDMAPNAGDFRLIDRSALKAFRRLRESNRYLRGMFHWIGFRQIGVPYGYFERYAGVRKYTFRRMVRLALDGLTSFTNAPLHLALYVGFAMAGLAFLTAIFAVVSKLIGLDLVPGWVSIMAGMSFIGGIQLSVLGVIGLYIGRMYDEVKRRPLYVVGESGGFMDGDTPSPATPGASRSVGSATTPTDDPTPRIGSNAP
jgi:polyisoprenyl-phosphate glycosyltransferase